MRQRYGLDPADYRAMVERQEGRCLICEDQPDPLVVDHDHETGEIRGLLCSTCNSGLGMFKDSPVLARRASDYLEGILTTHE